MTTFYLVRHGQVDRQATVVDPPLSAQGKREAAQVAAALRTRPLAKIYASPLRRAWETASLLAKALVLPIIVDPLLRERVNYGDLPGQTFEEFVAMWECCNREREVVPPIGDSSWGAGGRMEAFIVAMHAALPDGEVVAVTHGGLIADFLRNICTPSQLAEIHPEFANQPYAGEIMRNGAITTVEYRGFRGGSTRYVVKKIASLEHLHN